jgi:hypothetical protein
MCHHHDRSSGSPACLISPVPPAPNNDKSLGFILKDLNDFPDIEISPEHLTESPTDRVKCIYEETI